MPWSDAGNGDVPPIHLRFRCSSQERRPQSTVNPPERLLAASALFEADGVDGHRQSDRRAQRMLTTKLHFGCIS
jgi:hypothetical protein